MRNIFCTFMICKTYLSIFNLLHFYSKLNNASILMSAGLRLHSTYLVSLNENLYFGCQSSSFVVEMWPKKSLISWSECSVWIFAFNWSGCWFLILTNMRNSMHLEGYFKILFLLYKFTLSWIFFHSPEGFLV